MTRNPHGDGPADFKNAGSYTFTASLEGDDAVNYAFEEGVEQTKDVTIEKATVTKPTEDTREFTYSGGEQTYEVQGGGKEHFRVEGNTKKEANEGGYTVTVSLNDPENYRWAGEEESSDPLKFSFRIARAPITVTWSGGEVGHTYTYGKVTPPSANLEGKFGEDDLSVVIETKDGAFRNAGTYSYTAALDGTAKENYFIKTGETQVYTIGKAELTAQLSATVVYGDELAMDGVTVSVAGLQNGDRAEDIAAAVKGTVDGVGRLTSTYRAGTTHVGDPATVSCELRPELENYKIVFTEGNVTVTQREIALKLGSGSNTYGDEAHGSITADAERSGGEGNWYGSPDDEALLSGNLDYTFKKDDAGEAQPYAQRMAAGSYTVTAKWKKESALARDYKIVNEDTGTRYTVERKELVVTMTATVEYGEETPEVTLSYGGGLVSGDDAEALVRQAKEKAAFTFGGYTARTGVNKTNTLNVTSENKELENYFVRYTSCTLTITAREIKVKLTFRGRTYGDPVDDWVTVELSRADGKPGLWNAPGDTQEALTFRYELSGTSGAPTERTAADTYTVYTECTNANYSVGYEYGEGGNRYTVGKATVVVAWETLSSYVYKGSAFEKPKATANGVAGDELTLTVDFDISSPKRDAFRDAGRYVFAASIEGGLAGNYDLNNATTEIVVSPAEMEAKFHDDKHPERLDQLRETVFRSGHEHKLSLQIPEEGNAAYFIFRKGTDTKVTGLTFQYIVTTHEEGPHEGDPANKLEEFKASSDWRDFRSLDIRDADAPGGYTVYFKATDTSGNHSVLYGWYGVHVAHEQLTITLNEDSGLLSHVEYGEVDLTEALLEEGLERAIKSVMSLEDGKSVDKTEEFEGKFSNFSFYLRTKDDGTGNLYSIQPDGVHIGKDTSTPVHLPAGTYYLYVVYVEKGEETASKHIVFLWEDGRPSFEVTPREITVGLTFKGHAYGEDLSDWVKGDDPVRSGEKEGTWYADGENNVESLGLSYSLENVGTPSSATNAGTYRVIAVCGNENYRVTFFNKEGGELVYTIEKATVKKPDADSREFTYTGVEQVYTVAEDPDRYTVDGNRRTNANETGHDVTVHLIDQENYRWEDGDSADIVYKFVIKKVTLTVTAREHSITYGDAPSDHGADYVGFVNGERADVLKGTLSYTFDYVQYGDVGDSYTILPYGLSSDNYDICYLEGTLTVRAREIGVLWDKTSYTYTGSAFGLPAATAEGVGTDGTFTLVVSPDFEGDFLNAGEYRFKAALDGADDKTKNYVLKTDTMTHFYTVEKQRVAAPAIGSKVYNGTAQTADVADTAQYTVTENDGGINADSYSVTLTLKHPENYKWERSEEAELVLTFTIDKADYDMSGVTFEDGNFDYDAKEHSLAIGGTLPEGVAVTYDGNGMVEAGEYTVTAIFTGDARNYNAIPSMTATLTITAISHDLSGIRFDDVTVKYDGETHSIYIEGELPTNVTVSYEGNGQTEPDIYTVTAVFSDPDGAFARKTAKLTVLRMHVQSDLGGEDAEVVLDSEDGFDPTLELVVEEIEDVVRKYWAWEKDEVSEKYAVKLYKDGAEVPFEGKVTVRLLIPEAFREEDFAFVSSGGKGVEYTRDGDYVIFEAEGLSTYSFTRTCTPYFSIILLATGILLADAAVLTVLTVIVRKKRNKKVR